MTPKQYILTRTASILVILIYFFSHTSLTASGDENDKSKTVEQHIQSGEQALQECDIAQESREIPSNDAFTHGFRFGNFVTVRNLPVYELNCRFIELVHEPTQASIIHIQNDDSENVFSLAFQTLPYSSNGVPHVLEHMVLCGSEKYPVKDPFFSMRKRSLMTFMNASTGDDFTCYYASSQNEKDFYNLLDVYVDAVFYPKLRHMSFLQEAHRLEFSTPHDPSTPLVRKGVVYNEMKGNPDSPEQLASYALFQDTPYAYNAGGDPDVIPTLTHEEVKKFHSQNYHPSRCLFYFYGSFPLAKHLEFLETELLHKFSSAPKPDQIPNQPRFSETVRKEIEYNARKMEEAEVTTLAWLTYPVANVDKMFALSVLNSLLLDSDMSPLKRMILDSGMAHEVRGILNTEKNEIPYFITLNGAQGSIEEIEAKVHQFLEEIAERGFQQKEIDRVLHTFELERKDISRCHGPFGLSLFWRSAHYKLKGIDPLIALETERYVNKLKQEVIDHPDFFSELIREALLENSHKVVLKIHPSSLGSEEPADSEREELDRVQSSLTQEEKNSLVEQAKKLEVYQKQEDDHTCLPSISIGDISREIKSLPCEKDLVQKMPCYFSQVFTNHIDHITLAVPLPEEALKRPELFSLYCYLLTVMGCGDKSWKEALESVQDCTDGLYASYHFHPNVNDPDSFIPRFYISGRALSQDVDKLLALMFEYLHNPNFSDDNRLEELIKMHHSYLEGGLKSRFSYLSFLESAQHHSKPNKLLRLMMGAPYIRYIRDLVAHWNERKESFLEEVKELQKALHARRDPIVISSCDKESLERIKSYLKARSPTKWDDHSSTNNLQLSSRQESNRFTAIIGESSVSFSTFCIPAMAYSDPQAPYASLLGPLLTDVHLHPKIREQGGAYGAWASYDSVNGVFSFGTYRDPHIWRSYRAFIESLESIAQGNFNEDDLENAKREIIQRIDRPISRSYYANVAFSLELEECTEEMRRSFRQTVLDATCKDIQEVAQKLCSQLPSASFATVTGKHLLEKELKLFEKEAIEFSKVSL